MLLAVALLAASSSAWLPASGALPAARARPLTARRAACSTINMQMNLQNLTLMLTGCSNGVGVGLDEDNKVGMLRPGMPASKVLLVGDKVISWNDLPMVEVSGGRVVQRKLKDVVTPADEHTLVVEREKKSWDVQYGQEETPSWEKPSWEGSSSW